MKIISLSASGFIAIDYCEPFLGELPTNVKEKTDGK